MTDKTEKICAHVGCKKTATKFGNYCKKHSPARGIKTTATKKTATKPPTKKKVAKKAAAKKVAKKAAKRR